MIEQNPPDRCYHCKREIFGILNEYADRVGSVLADGTNLSDMSDYRPGYRAITELGVISPLKEAGLTKDEIREALHELSIGDVAKMWDKPAFACLISRIPYGETITEKKLSAIYEAEEYLKECGFTQLRVRCHEIAAGLSGSEGRFMARIELLPKEMKRLFQASDADAAEIAVASDEDTAKVAASSDEDTTEDAASSDEDTAEAVAASGKVRGVAISEIEARLKAIGFEYVTLDLGGYVMGKMNVEIASSK